MKINVMLDLFVRIQCVVFVLNAGDHSHQNLLEFTASDPFVTHLELFPHSHVIHGRFEQIVPHLFFPSWSPTQDVT